MFLISPLNLKVHTEHTNIAGHIFLFFFFFHCRLVWPRLPGTQRLSLELFFLSGPTWASGSLSTVCQGQNSLDFVTCDTQPVTTSTRFTSKLPLTCSQPFLYRSCPSPQLSGSSAALLKSPPWTSDNLLYLILKNLLKMINVYLFFLESHDWYLLSQHNYEIASPFLSNGWYIVLSL